MTTATIQDTILDQIKSIDPLALMAWGARDLKASGTSLYMRVNGPKFKRGWIEVELDEGLDLYVVRAIQMYKFERKIKKELTQVYAEDLVRIIDSIVG